MTGPRDTHGEDAAWRDIVDNYGDRPLLEPEPTPPAPQPDDQPDDHPELATDDSWLEERFVPPPPPLPRVSGDRLVAWAGVVAGPFVLLFLTILRIHPPTLVTWALVLGFLGGFGYLVAQMPRGPRDPYDDGARL